MIQRPLHIYVNWSAYDELSDQIPLTEDLAMNQFEHLLRLRGQGVRFDAYIMDCFWYQPDSGYRHFRRDHWQDDGERWLAACRTHDVLPGLWFACNNVGHFCGMALPEAWRASVDPAADPRWAAACLFEGPFLDDLMAAFAHWYHRGVRLFKLDFLNLRAHLPHHRLSLMPNEILSLNAEAFRSALMTFRRDYPEAVLLAYNGFEETPIIDGTDIQPRQSLDPRWLDAVDCFYSGDPRPADVPSMNFWRAKEVYSDHMVRSYRAQGFSARVIDNAGFMIGTTGTCYHRGKQAWKGMLLLSLARGGWAITYYGNLDLIDDDDAKWWGRAQALLGPLVHHGENMVLGDLPGTGNAYAFVLHDGTGHVVCAVNPNQAQARLSLPWLHDGVHARVLFSDVGFVPRCESGELLLGAEQMVVLGTGRYAQASWDLGLQTDVRIPERTDRLPITVFPEGRNRVRGTCMAPTRGALRLIMRQHHQGRAKRSTGGPKPAGQSLGRILTISARQTGLLLPLTIAYDHVIWSGLSWAVGEIAANALCPGQAIEVIGTSQDETTVELSLEAWATESA